MICTNSGSVTRKLLCTLACVVLGGVALVTAAEPSPDATKATDTQPTKLLVEEARRQAELLHETIHATLQVVHHHYFREDEGIAIPAVSLKSVFRELARRRGVEVRWLAVNAQAMNVDHEPRGAFEQEAVKAIASGADHYEAAADGIYRRVGAITLESECLKCHLPTRTNVTERAAGLLIALPVRGE